MKHAIINITLIVLFFLAASLAERLASMSGAKGRAAGAASLSSLRGLGHNNTLKGA